jgi:hypothetical protein
VPHRIALCVRGKRSSQMSEVEPTGTEARSTWYQEKPWWYLVVSTYSKQIAKFIDDKATLISLSWINRRSKKYSRIDPHLTAKELYASLPLTEFDTRLVTIFPGRPEDAIVCKLQTAAVRSDLKYEALSYVWGGTFHHRSIRVNRCRFRITANLHNALHHLRDTKRPRRLWIDALCINQEEYALPLSFASRYPMP